MAKTFYYDDKDMLGLTLTEGAFGISGGVLAFSAGDVTSNQERLNDQSTATAISSFSNVNANGGDAIVIPFGTNRKIDFIAVYMSAAETHDLKFAKEGSTDNQFDEITDAHFTSTFSVGWALKEFTEVVSDNYMIYTFNGDIEYLTEVIIGSKLEFEFNPEIGMGEVESFNTEVNTSIGGIEYAVKIGNPRTTMTMDFSSISSTFKDSLQSMEAEVQDYKKFIYSENGATGPFHYVRLDGPINFKEVSYQRYSATITLIEQLS